MADHFGFGLRGKHVRLAAIGQNPQEKPTRQMGGSRPAQMIAPLKAKLIGVEMGSMTSWVSVSLMDMGSTLCVVLGAQPIQAPH
jgi:hypothetical protein